MAWTNIPNANLAAGAPIRSVDLLAIRDNFAAMANQDAGAPPLVKSLNGQTGAITNTDYVAIGSYYFSADDTSIGDRTIGSTYAGSTFKKLDSTGTRVNNPLAGTWRLMGDSEASANRSKIYVRVS